METQLRMAESEESAAAETEQCGVDAQESAVAEAKPRGWWQRINPFRAAGASAMEGVESKLAPIEERLQAQKDDFEARLDAQKDDFEARLDAQKDDIEARAKGIIRYATGCLLGVAAFTVGLVALLGRNRNALPGK